MKLFNAFSIQMVGCDFSIKGQEISIDEVKAIAEKEGVDSYIGHTDTAEVISNLLGVKVVAQRRFGTIERGDYAIIAQIIGGRLPEGSTKLPEGMEIKFVKVCRGE